MPAKNYRRFIDEPAMSDKLLLLNLDDCIGFSFGNLSSNIINFKMLQTVLYTLARQMRILEQDVEIKFDDFESRATAPPPMPTQESSTSTDEEDPSKQVRPKRSKRRKLTTETSKHKLEADRSRKMSDGITITVGKTSTIRESRSHIGSIQVVARADFDALEALVNQMLTKLRPTPMPTMPDDDQLKADLIAGTATLTDTMEALRVNMRIKITEQALTRMARILTQLAGAGALPKEFAECFVQMQEDLKAWGIELASIEGLDITMYADAATDSPSVMEQRDSALSQSLLEVSPSALSAVSEGPMAAPVTQGEMEIILKVFRDDLLQNIITMTAKSTAGSENALSLAKSITNKVERAENLDTRIEELHELTHEYAEHIDGFGTGINTQLQSYQEQMVMIRTDLKGGLTYLESVSANTETLAVIELRRTYNSLVMELETAVQSHTSLVDQQKKICEEMSNLMEAMEVLNEQKADRDEVNDGLRDKADLLRLDGLLHANDFRKIRAALFDRLHMSQEKFDRQDSAWVNCMKDLKAAMDKKADMIQMLALTEFAAESIKDIKEKLLKLEYILGLPKATLVTRPLATRADTQIDPYTLPIEIDIDLYQKKKKKHRIPSLVELKHTVSLAAEEPCLKDTLLPGPPDTKDHVCQRWVGGSHTMLSKFVIREAGQPILLEKPHTKRFTGFGNDGRSYHMEQKLEPCVECNKILGDSSKAGGGGGDRG